MTKLITPAQLANVKGQELRDLFAYVSRELANTDAESVERAKALGSLENISRAMAARFA